MSAIMETAGPPAWYKMKKRPKHLPASKLDELNAIVAAIRERHDIEMIILFGSHARGDWVEDRYEEDHITYEYHSDFDILIVTADKKSERNVAYDNDLKDALEPRADGTRVNYIVHTIHHVNQMLSERRYFFMDILKEGYLLYDSGRYKLARPPKELPPKTRLRHAEEYFEEWMDSADGFFEGVGFYQSRGRLKIAAFQLHQSAERYITCLLLVQTGYRPKEHDLQNLINQAAGFDPRFTDVFPKDTDQNKRLFDLLRRAYVDARYSKRYAITDEELSAIAKRVEDLKELTAEVCENKIAGLRHAAESDQT
ncbi:HEPN domain-containing protein [Thiohalomonas denitrificans]|uniref:HEPN domain-containing protein n=1 Tax=Thiohalomonas denitrificans TaxID=415747 RepID=UPI0026F0772D|nr:HEPN domain-containing protein [Thiohalomonas denitrificans]